LVYYLLDFQVEQGKLTKTRNIISALQLLSAGLKNNKINKLEEIVK